MVNAIQQFFTAISSNVEHDKAYWDNVRKASAALEKASSADLDRLYNQVSERQPPEYGPLVFVLGAKLKKPPTDTQTFINLLGQFNVVASNVNSNELDHIHDKFSYVMGQLASMLMDQNAAIHGIRLMQNAVKTLSRGHTGVITNLHARLFCLCLEAKRPDPAIPFLDLDAANCFLNVHNLDKVTCENALLYFYYGGLIKFSLKDLEGAAHMFESCVCMPALSASSIMLEALKKLIMLNLILGRPNQLPAYCAPPIRRLAQIKCQKYQGIAQSYLNLTEHRNNKMTLLRFKRQMDKMSVELAKNNNVGLAQELYMSAVRNNISKLPEVFSKLQIFKVAKYCRIDADNVCIQFELERFLQSNKIEGKIDAHEGTVSFQPVERDAELEESCLDDATDACAALDDLLRNSQRVIELHPAILARQQKKHH
ncbi:COP9 signalosome complex subunit 3 [Aphelenchoides bicaudatus]|nr:COP9 signalosome complex subunit 3 [Aphelenchoides bicaudatus]